jgi:hypothetical protein
LQHVVVLGSRAAWEASSPRRRACASPVRRHERLRAAGGRAPCRELRDRLERGVHAAAEAPSRAPWLRVTRIGKIDFIRRGPRQGRARFSVRPPSAACMCIVSTIRTGAAVCFSALPLAVAGPGSSMLAWPAEQLDLDQLRARPRPRLGRQREGTRSPTRQSTPGSAGSREVARAGVASRRRRSGRRAPAGWRPGPAASANATHNNARLEVPIASPGADRLGAAVPVRGQYLPSCARSLTSRSMRHRRFS